MRYFFFLHTHFLWAVLSHANMRQQIIVSFVDFLHIFVTLASRLVEVG